MKHVFDETLEVLIVFDQPSDQNLREEIPKEDQQKSNQDSNNDGNHHKLRKVILSYL
jgi:hypothetical protein